MTRNLLYLLMFLLFPSSVFADEWQDAYRQIEKSIVAPTFPEFIVLITDFGADTCATALENQRAINRAIRRCSRKGGGRVVVPAGDWNTGAITLLSNVNLVVSKGAHLLFSADTHLYPLVETRWEGMDLMNYSPLIYAFRQVNVAVTGEGILDGQASRTAWWPMCGAEKYGWNESVAESQKYGSRSDLLRMNDAGVPVKKRVFGQGKGLRPQFLQFNQCENVLIEGVTIINSPFWVVHPLLSRNVIMRGLHIENSGPNGDGCDPESVDGMLIENCYFNTGDDCIAVKSGRNGDGRRWNRPSRNIIVRHCQMANGHGGIVIGSEASGGVSNVFVEDCTMDSPQLERVVRIKTNTCRGGIIENVFVRNVRVGQCKEAVLKINLQYEPREQSERGHYPVVRNIFLSNVNCEKSRYGAFIDALTDSTNVYNISVNGCRWNGVTEGGNLLRGMMHDVNFVDVIINGETCP